MTDSFFKNEFDDLMTDKDDMWKELAGDSDVGFSTKPSKFNVFSQNNKYQPFSSIEVEMSQHMKPKEEKITVERPHVKNLDAFLKRVYKYYTEHGMSCILASRITHLLILAFVILFSTCLFLFVDWNGLIACKDEKSCKSLPEYLTTKHAFSVSIWHITIYIYFLVLVLYWIWNVIALVPTFKSAHQMKGFYENKLKITTRDLQTIEWEDIVERLSRLHQSGQFRLTDKRDTLSPLDAAVLIMRKENMLVSMVNKDVLRFDLPFGWLKGKTFFTKQLEWNLRYCVLDRIFDNSHQLSRAFANVSSLKRRFRLMALINFLLMPFIFLFMLVFFFFKNSEEFHSQKDYLGPRKWSLWSLWKFREFNELPHFFDKRINLSISPAKKYLEQFPSPLTVILARFGTFCLGAVAGVLLLLAVWEESILLHVQFWDRNLLWYVAIATAALAALRGMVPAPENSVLDPKGVMEQVNAHTHYMPQKWRNRTATFDVRDEFLKLFQFRATLFLEEMVSVLFTPLILGFRLPKYAEDIIVFVQNTTVSVDRFGCVSGYSIWDYNRFGDMNYGAPMNGKHFQLRSKDGKMEKSCLNFKLAHRSFRSSCADTIIKSLRDFQDSKSDQMLGSFVNVARSMSITGSQMPRASNSMTQFDRVFMQAEQLEVDCSTNKENYFFWMDKFYEESVGEVNRPLTTRLVEDSIHAPLIEEPHPGTSTIQIQPTLNQHHQQQQHYQQQSNIATSSSLPQSNGLDHIKSKINNSQQQQQHKDQQQDQTINQPQRRHSSASTTGKDNMNSNNFQTSGAPFNTPLTTASRVGGFDSSLLVKQQQPSTNEPNVMRHNRHHHHHHHDHRSHTNPPSQRTTSIGGTSNIGNMDPSTIIDRRTSVTPPPLSVNPFLSLDSDGLPSQARYQGNNKHSIDDSMSPIDRFLAADSTTAAGDNSNNFAQL